MKGLQNISEKFESGSISSLNTDISTVSLPWSAHVKFEGVFLKHIITGQETGGALSCHLVKIEPGCCIDHHLHNGKIEVHEIIDGSGVCVLNGREIPYNPGIITLIPADFDHKVTADANGLFILAKFSPALL